MTIKVSAIYVNGVLRPLRPLSLPENARVQIQVLATQMSETQALLLEPEDAAAHRRAVDAALVAAGLSQEIPSASSGASAISDERREELAYRFAEGGPVSDLIIAERGER